jgi:putative NADH-flavin reductase
MKIVVFGATGSTGKNVVERALAGGHDVVAVARRPEAVAAQPRLTVQKGDVTDAESVAAAVAGADAVISAIGPAKNGDPGTLISTGVKNIVAGCSKHGVRRLVLESGMIVSDGTGLPLLGRWAVALFGTIFPKLKADKIVAEAAVTASSLDWVILRPPNLSHGAATGQYLAAPGAPIVPAKAITHSDCAEALLKAATEPTWVKQIVNVGRA